MKVRLGLLSSALVVVTLAGCGATTRLEGERYKPPAVFKISTRKLPPEPTYNRVRWANLETLPSPELPRDEAPRLNPILRFDVQNAKLEDAAKTLAGPFQYSSYCASTIANHKITLNRLGTIDEIGEAISHQAGIKVVVDHEGRSVRFFPQQAEIPQFYADKKE